jgi:hypothetical protein
MRSDTFWLEWMSVTGDRAVLVPATYTHITTKEAEGVDRLNRHHLK